MTPSCDDCWSRAKATDDPIATYRRLLGEHEDNQPVLVHDGVRVFQSDCLALLRTLPDNSVDAIVTDPPYGLADHKPATITAALTAWATGDRDRVPDGRGFMGRRWDAFVPPPAVWDECLRVLKPGGHMLVFAGTRTVDLMGLSIRLAGFEIRDSITWLYGQGFPKSSNVARDQRFCQCEHAEPAVPYSHVPEGSSADVPSVRGGVLPVSDEAAGDAAASVLAPVPGQAGRGSTADDQRGGIAGADAGLAPAEGAPGAAERVLEGRSDLQAGEGQLCRSALRQVPGGSDVDGPVGRVRDGAPASHGAVDRATPSPGGVREPYRPESSEQRSREPRAVSDERGPQARRGWPVCGGCGKQRVLGVGTALKPASEPIIVARKPLSGTVAANVLAHGTGALNVDACRVATDEVITNHARGSVSAISKGIYGDSAAQATHQTEGQVSGRWPANVVLDEHAAAALDAQSGTLTSGALDRSKITAQNDIYGAAPATRTGTYAPDSGGASRFFYCAKAPTKERPKVDGVSHPTVKPLTLMRWLVRLVTPPGGTVLDPFAGSGTTGEAAALEGFEAVLVEFEAAHIPLIVKRLTGEDPVREGVAS